MINLNSILVSVVTMASIVSLSTYAVEYDLEAAYQNGLSHHPNGKILESELNELRLGVRKIKADYMPEVSGVIGGERRQALDDSSVDSNRFVAELRFKYNLYRFNQISDQLEALEKMISQKESQTRWWKNDLLRSLKSLFYSAEAISRKIDLINNEIKYNAKLTQMVKKRKKSGLVGDSDLYDISLRKDQMQTTLIDLEEEQDHLFDQIRKISFLSHDTKIKVSSLDYHPHFNLSLDQLIEQVKRTNKEVRTKILESEASMAKLQEIKKKRLPEINLMGRYGNMRIDEQYANKGTEGLVGVYIDIPIFDGGKKSSTREIYQEKLKQKQLAVTALKENQIIEVTHKYELLNKIHKRIDLLNESSKRGKKYFKSVLSEYDRGVKNSLDLVSARDRVFKLSLDLIDSNEKYLLTGLMIEKLTGENLQENL